MRGKFDTIGDVKHVREKVLEPAEESITATLKSGIWEKGRSKQKA